MVRRAGDKVEESQWVRFYSPESGENSLKRLTGDKEYRDPSTRPHFSRKAGSLVLAQDDKGVRVSCAALKGRTSTDGFVSCGFLRCLLLADVAGDHAVLDVDDAPGVLGDVGFVGHEHDGIALLM